jgi:hypothetical protein
LGKDLSAPGTGLASGCFASAALLSPLIQSRVPLYHSTGFAASGTDEQAPVDSATKTATSTPLRRTCRTVNTSISFINTNGRCQGSRPPLYVFYICRQRYALPALQMGPNRAQSTRGYCGSHAFSVFGLSRRRPPLDSFRQFSTVWRSRAASSMPIILISFAGLPAHNLSFLTHFPDLSKAAG